MKRKTVDLEAFLEHLDEEDAAQIRAAAARIDELEHAAQRIGASDRQFLIMFAIAGLMVLLAAVMMLGDFQLLTGGYTNATALIALLLAGSFPALVLIYSLRMRERTRLDDRKFEIIETYFLPYDAIYLPPGADRAKGMVTMASKRRGWHREPEPDSKVKKPGWYW